MGMDEEFLEVNDLDWFASCQDGSLAHFATRGRGAVPLTVRRSISVYKEIYDYFCSMEASVNVEVVESNLPEFICDVQRQRYLQSFINMASKGLFSYDFSDEGGYKLIAKPQESKEYCDLPMEIKNTICVLSLRGLDVLGVDNFL
ncbi:hypothetical protein HX882_14135 [Pseudomonas gingeri]|uniref:Uncharacterized protein n=1 Tax=Pseudomonas gingeri TaxID=117681 RepID=A0A7Y7XBV0_9PSED|nr:hypothetical protein [Pseudomonas gingeri]NWB97034.1 hypothetical protein [Pseudomonas gingeri]